MRPDSDSGGDKSINLYNTTMDRVTIGIFWHDYWLMQHALMFSSFPCFILCGVMADHNSHSITVRSIINHHHNNISPPTSPAHPQSMDPITAKRRRYST